MADLNWLKVVLAEQHKTGKWLTVEIGMTQCTISMWCNNKAHPDLETIGKIASILSVGRREFIKPSEK